MTHFTMDNTEGFTKEELNILNAALEQMITEDFKDLDDDNEYKEPQIHDFTKYYADRLNNEFVRGECDTVEQLIKAVRA